MNIKRKELLKMITALQREVELLNRDIDTLLGDDEFEKLLIRSQRELARRINKSIWGVSDDTKRETQKPARDRQKT